MPKKRRGPKGSPCKPCWELKYCPYGPLVELSPLLSDSSDLDRVKAGYAEVLEAFRTGLHKEERAILSEAHRLLYLIPENWEEVLEYDPKYVSCNVWGHVCPVFLAASGVTETKERRRMGRHIPRDIMLKVVRRDDYTCQICHRRVPDNEIEFDHIIPFSFGGPTSVENLRLLCRDCNREKSDSLHEVVDVNRRTDV
ncbi:MAG TPA: HNH endonuclease signature motif containing protein [Longimicrobium sp.]